jgi:hypothetical protein
MAYRIGDWFQPKAEAGIVGISSDPAAKPLYPNLVSSVCEQMRWGWRRGAGCLT